MMSHCILHSTHCQEKSMISDSVVFSNLYMEQSPNKTFWRSRNSSTVGYLTLIGLLYVEDISCNKCLLGSNNRLSMDSVNSWVHKTYRHQARSWPMYFSRPIPKVLPISLSLLKCRRKLKVTQGFLNIIYFQLEHIQNRSHKAWYSNISEEQVLVIK